MLTKDLIRVRTYKGELRPQFIDTTEEPLQRLAEELIALYDVEMNASRLEITEAVMGLVNGSRDIKLAKGLNKLILDRCTFSHGEEFDHKEFRQNLFAYSANLLRETRSYSEFKKAVEEQFDTEKLGDIYSDHPECEVLTSCKSITATELLNRYNIALVQSLLIQCNSLKVTLFESDSAKLRRLFSYLKFFRLLADISYSPKIKSKVTLTITGPGSVLESVNKYGLQLASFFPAIVQMKQWELEASVKYNRKVMPLKLNQKSGLHSHFSRSAFIPEEIVLFGSEFSKRAGETWKIVEHQGIVKLSDGSLRFPDFTFEHSSGKIVSMELFHRWHSNSLLTLLQSETLPEDDSYIIGVDRSVGKKGAVQELLESSSYFEKRGFRFTDFPAVTIVSKLLDSLLV